MAKEENIILPVIGLGALLLIFSGGGNNGPLPSAEPPGKLSPTDFVKRYWADAVKSQQQTTIPALVTIAQAGLESGWGKSAPGYNFFGIKADKSWTGPVHVSDTTEVYNGQTVHIKDTFRSYPNAAASFMDHGKFFLQNARYHKALQYVKDPAAFVQQISLPVLNPGYATAPNYSAVMFDVMKDVMKILQAEHLI